jgi:hypothetical protein
MQPAHARRGGAITHLWCSVPACAAQVSQCTHPGLAHDAIQRVALDAARAEVSEQRGAWQLEGAAEVEAAVDVLHLLQLGVAPHVAGKDLQAGRAGRMVARTLRGAVCEVQVGSHQGLGKEGGGTGVCLEWVHGTCTAWL